MCDALWIQQLLLSSLKSKKEGGGAGVLKEPVTVIICACAQYHSTILIVKHQQLSLWIPIIIHPSSSASEPVSLQLPNLTCADAIQILEYEATSY